MLFTCYESSSKIASTQQNEIDQWRKFHSYYNAYIYIKVPNLLIQRFSTFAHRTLEFNFHSNEAPPRKYAYFQQRFSVHRVLKCERRRLILLRHMVSIRTSRRQNQLLCTWYKYRSIFKQQNRVDSIFKVVYCYRMCKLSMPSSS